MYCYRYLHIATQCVEVLSLHVLQYYLSLYDIACIHNSTQSVIKSI